MRSLKQLFESKLTFSKRKYVLILQKLVLKNRKGELLDGICIILDVLERLREYDNIVLEATAVLTSILSVPEGAASVDRQRGKQILQLCMKRWKDDEFIPFEAEYALKQLKAQQSAIKQLSQNALKRAIKEQSLKQIFIMLDSNSKNKNVALPCIVGILKIVDSNDTKLQKLRQREDWLRLLVNAIDMHNRVESIISSGSTLLTMIASQNNTLRRQVAKEGALGVAVRSIYVYAENRNVLQQLFWLLNELILDRHNIRDLITLNGDKAMNFFQAARRRNKRNDDVDDHVKIPTRLERLCRELPKIREELKQTGRFSFEMENFNGAMSGISPAKV